MLELLQQSELASVRLTCKLFERQSTPLVTSIKKQSLSQRFLDACLSKFPNVHELQTSAVISVRLAPQLTKLQSLVISTEGSAQALSALAVMTNLTRLRLKGFLPTKRGPARLTSLRCLSLHHAYTYSNAFFNINDFLAALPLLEELSFCAATIDLTALSTCRHLTALHLGFSGYRQSVLASLTELKCLSLESGGCSEAISHINSLSCLSALHEFHWHHDSHFNRSYPYFSTLLGPSQTLNLPHLTCLMLSGRSEMITRLVKGLTTCEGLQALDISISEGGLESFGRLVANMGLQAFKAASAYPLQTLQAGRELTSMSKAPQAWIEQWKAHYKPDNVMWNNHRCYCCCDVTFPGQPEDSM